MHLFSSLTFFCGFMISISSALWWLHPLNQQCSVTHTLPCVPSPELQIFGLWYTPWGTSSLVILLVGLLRCELGSGSHHTVPWGPDLMNCRLHVATLALWGFVLALFFDSFGWCPSAKALFWLRSFAVMACVGKRWLHKDATPHLPSFCVSCGESLFLHFQKEAGLQFHFPFVHFSFCQIQL